MIPTLIVPHQRPGRLSRGIVLRFAFALAIACLVALPAAADVSPRLRGDVTAQNDVLTFGDLVADAPPESAQVPVFRAPALGETGTIQTSRILDAAQALGIGSVETGGRAQVRVTRAVRRIEAGQIEAAVKEALAAREGIVMRGISIVFDGAPLIQVPPSAQGSPAATELSYDSRTRRFTAVAYVGDGPDERQGQILVGGRLVEMVEVAVLTRSVERGEALSDADVRVEQRLRESVPADSRFDEIAFDGHAARRALPAGTALRRADLVRPELVARGASVLVLYEAPGMTLTLRGRANEAGAKGDVIAVTNLQSRKTFHATVVGSGQVSVIVPGFGPLASAAAIRQ